MNYKTSIIAGIACAGLGVAIGAFGAHGLKDILASTGRADTFELAVRYQFYHAFALIVTGILAKQFNTTFKWASFAFLLGILFFSGSLYVLSLTGITILGAITPVGGVCFIVGWLSLLLRLMKVQ